MRKTLSLIRLFKLANAFLIEKGLGMEEMKFLGEYLTFVNEHKNDKL